MPFVCAHLIHAVQSESMGGSRLKIGPKTESHYFHTFIEKISFSGEIRNHDPMLSLNFMIIQMLGFIPSKSRTIFKVQYQKLKLLK